MIIPDVNILLYAYNSGAKKHSLALPWWESTLHDRTPVGLPWISILGFIRIITSLRSVERPLPVATAIAHVNSWLKVPSVRILPPGERHAAILFELLENLGTAGNLTTDAHLAALAIEYRAELISCDTDFARFPHLRWRKPF